MVDRNAIWDWLGAFTGVIFVVIVVVGAAIVGDVFGDLSPDVPSSQMARLLEASRDQMEVGATVSLFGLLFFFWFLAYLRLRLLQAEGDSGWLTSVVYEGGLVGIAVLLGHLAVTLAMTSVSNNGSDTAVAKALHAFAWNSTLLWGPPFIASTGAAFFVIIRFGGIPKWLGWVGLAPTILLSMPWFGIVFFPGWILILSAVLTFQAWRGAPTGASELSQ